MKRKKIMKSELISFRPEEDLSLRFQKHLERLGVSITILADRAVRKGLDEAAAEIAEERKKEAQKLLKRLGKPPTLPMWPVGIPHHPHLETA